jgi:hypothetical protein
MLEASAKCRDLAQSFMNDKGSLSPSDAIAMIWALRAAGLDVPIEPEPLKESGHSLSRKIRVLRPQIFDALKAAEGKP